jgi:gas vesicle protein
MIGSAKTAMKFFTYGLLLGLLFAPRSGAETRAQLLNWISQTVKETIGMGGNA